MAQAPAAARLPRRDVAATPAATSTSVGLPRSRDGPRDWHSLSLRASTASRASSAASAARRLAPPALAAMSAVGVETACTARPLCRVCHAVIVQATRIAGTATAPAATASAVLSASSAAAASGLVDGAEQHVEADGVPTTASPSAPSAPASTSAASTSARAAAAATTTPAVAAHGLLRGVMLLQEASRGGDSEDCPRVTALPPLAPMPRRLGGAQRRGRAAEQRRGAVAAVGKKGETCGPGRARTHVVADPDRGPTSNC